MTAIDYEKYNNMSQRQLLNSLINAEKKEQKLKAEAEKKLSEIKELIKFLKAKMKESLDAPKYYTLESSPALNKIRNDFEKLPPEKQEQLNNELEKELSNANHHA